MVNGQSIVPAGFVMPFAANSTPGGYLLCNGAAVSRTTYAELFAAIGTLYGAGDGVSTFNLPNLTDRFIQGSGTAGVYKNAGLPNIRGSINTNQNLLDPYGAFYWSGELSTNYTHNEKSFSGNVNILFDASRSNAIYGASTTVQPPALTMRYYIKY
jgi:phage-related tail fiber protein